MVPDSDPPEYSYEERMGPGCVQSATGRPLKVRFRDMFFLCNVCVLVEIWGCSEDCFLRCKNRSKTEQESFNRVSPESCKPVVSSVKCPDSPLCFTRFVRVPPGGANLLRSVRGRVVAAPGAAELPVAAAERARDLGPLEPQRVSAFRGHSNWD